MQMLTNCLTLNASKSYSFEAKETKLMRMLAHVFNILEGNFCWGGITRFKLWTKGKKGTKLEIYPISQVFLGEIVLI